MANEKISQLASGSAAQATDLFVVARSGANYSITGLNLQSAIADLSLGDGTNSINFTAGGITVTDTSGSVWGGATGGAQGSGTINAKGLYVNGTAVGTVTSFSAGNLSPLFTSSVATASSTPALSFSLSTQNANIVFAGPSSGSAAAPTFRALVTADLPSGVLTTSSTIAVTQLATSGTWAFAGTLSGNFTMTGNTLQTGTDTLGLSSYTAGISNSPSLVIAGSYESSSTGPTYAEDSWTLQNVIGSGLNGTSTLSFTHSGTSGVSEVSIPTLAVTTINSNTLFTGNPVLGLSSYTAAIANSPTLTMAGSYESASTPTYAEDSWTQQVNVGTGVNGTSTLEFSHSGTSGNAYFDIHTQNGTNPSLIFDGDTTSGFGRYSGAAGYLAAYIANNASMAIYAGGTLSAVLGGGSSYGNQNGAFFGAYQAGGQTWLGQFQNNNLTAIQSYVLINETAEAIFKGTGTGTQVGCVAGGTFSPASGGTNFVCFEVAPTIDQTSSASGNYTALLVDVTETAFLGTTAKLLDLQVGNTSKFYVDHSGILYLPNSSNTGIGNGSDTNMQAPAQSTGTGPASLTAVSWEKINVNGATYWIPLFQ